MNNPDDKATPQNWENKNSQFWK